MSDLERSMHMWRKINPGCMEPTTRLPKSTYNSHFGPLQPGAVEVRLAATGRGCTCAWDLRFRA